MKPGTLLAPAGLGRRNHSYCTWLTPYAKAGRCIICNERLEYLHSEFSKDRATKCVAENFSRRAMGKKKKSSCIKMAGLGAREYIGHLGFGAYAQLCVCVGVRCRLQANADSPSPAHRGTKPRNT